MVGGKARLNGYTFSFLKTQFNVEGKIFFNM